MTPKSSKEILNLWIAEHGLRRTPERIAILEAAERAGQWFTPAEVRQQLSEGPQGLSVSLTTVYSTLALLQEAGLVRSHLFDPRRGVVYEMTTGSRGSRAEMPYLVCRLCGRVRRLRDVDSSLRDIRSVRLTGFRPELYELTIFGLCTACQRKSRKKPSSSTAKSVSVSVPEETRPSASANKKTSASSLREARPSASTNKKTSVSNLS